MRRSIGRALKRLVHPCVRAVVKPAVRLQLAVQLVCERPAGFEGAFHEVLQALDDAFGLRVTRVAEVPVDAQLPAERREVVGRSAARRVQAGLAIPHQRLRKRTQRPQAAADPEQQVRGLLGEDHRPGTGTRVAQTRNDDIRLAGLAVTDRDLVLRFPHVELADLTGPIDRALKRALIDEERPDLAQIVINDRLATHVAQRRDQLTDALPRRSFDGLRYAAPVAGAQLPPAAALVGAFGHHVSGNSATASASHARALSGLSGGTGAMRSAYARPPRIQSMQVNAVCVRP